MHDIPTISKIRTGNYKNLMMKDDLRLNHLNLFIGPNGSGKSNLINLLSFIKNCLISKPVAGRGITGFEEAVDEFGDWRILDGTVSPPATVSFRFEMTPTEIIPKGAGFELDLMVKDSAKKVIVNRESLYDVQTTSEPFYYYSSHDRESGKGVVSVYTDSQKQKSRFEPLSDVPVNRLTLTSVSELLEASHFPPENTPIYKVRRHIADTLESWQFCNANNMNLQHIRKAESKIGPGDLFLSPSGENLPLVMDNLIQKDFDFDERINDAMKEALPWTRKIRAVRSGRLSLTVECVR